MLRALLKSMIRSSTSHRGVTAVLAPTNMRTLHGSILSLSIVPIRALDRTSRSMTAAECGSSISSLVCVFTIHRARK